MEQDEVAYRGGVQQLVEWCDSNFLALNVSKTKELVVDIRVAPTDPETEPITIKGQSVEMVSAYKYLGVVIDNKLSWTPHIDACYKKAQKKMYLLRKLNIFKVEQAIMQLFYQAVIQNAIFFNLVCFFGNTKKGDIGRLEKITRTAGRILRADPPRGGGGGGLASGSGPLCMFVFVICVTARRFSLPLRTKIKS